MNGAKGSPAGGAAGGFGAPTDVLILSPQQAEAIVRVVEAAPHVRRRHQFFVWTQSQLHALLPHQVLVCGAYQRERRALVFEAFHSIVLPPAVLAQMADAQGPLLQALLRAWVGGGGVPLVLETAKLAAAGLDETVLLLQASGIEMLLVHGVSRPQRPAEIESFFAFASSGRWAGAPLLAHLELLLPHLHASWQRVIAAEHESSPVQAAAAVPVPRAPPARGLTQRECQILLWVREGKSNQQVGDVLGISPLTVKNHIQKILRKLGASNRAHAVAEAMALGLFDGPAG